MSEEEKTTQEPVEENNLEKERDEYLAGWKRAKADLINFKKEEEDRFAKTILYSTAQVVKEFIPTLDSLGFALDSVKGDEKAEKGMTMIQSQFTEALKKIGVTKIEVKPGDEFDPGKHEAMMQEELTEENKDQDGKVTEVLVPGYTLQEHVIRPVKVKVGKFTEK